MWLSCAGHVYLAGAGDLSLKVFGTANHSLSYAHGYNGVGNLTTNNGIVRSYDAANQLTAAQSRERAN